METTALHDPATDLSKWERRSEPLEQSPAPAEKPAEVQKPQGQTEAKPAVETPKPAETSIDDAGILKALTEKGLQFQSFDEIKAAIQERQTLQEKVKELAGKTIEFPSEQAKALYDFAVKHPGSELASAKRYLDLVQLDLQKTDPKQVQFEAFLLKYPQLSREEGKAIFEEDYEQNYGDGNFEGKALLKFKHDQATREAQTAIEQAVKAYKEAPEDKSPDNLPPKEEIERINAGIDNALKEFKNASITLGEYTTKIGEKIPQGNLNIAMQPEEAAEFRKILADPQIIMDRVLDKVNGANGMNWQDYVNTMYMLAYPQKVYAQIHSQGVEQGILAMINQAKNNSREKPLEADKGSPVTKKTWAQSIDEARANQNV